MARAARLTRDARREQLMGVGTRIFGERGYEATTVEEIAERAEVSKPLVYEHFGGKEGLYEAVVDREIERLLGMLVGSLAETVHPREAVERAADAFLRYIETDPDGFRILVRDAPFGVSRGSLPGILGSIAERAEEILARELGERGLDVAAAPLFARALVGMVALVGQWWLEVGEPEREAVVGHLVNLAWDGLRGLELKTVAEA